MVSWADTLHEATLTYSIQALQWCGIYIYDYAAGAWTMAEYVYQGQ